MYVNDKCVIYNYVKNIYRIWILIRHDNNKKTIVIKVKMLTKTIYIVISEKYFSIYA